VGPAATASGVSPANAPYSPATGASAEPAKQQSTAVQVETPHYAS